MEDKEIEKKILKSIENNGKSYLRYCFFENEEYGKYHLANESNEVIRGEHDNNGINLIFDTRHQKYTKKQLVNIINDFLNSELKRHQKQGVEK